MVEDVGVHLGLVRRLNVPAVGIPSDDTVVVWNEKRTGSGAYGIEGEEGGRDPQQVSTVTSSEPYSCACSTARLTPRKYIGQINALLTVI